MLERCTRLRWGERCVAPGESDIQSREASWKWIHSPEGLSDAHQIQMYDRQLWAAFTATVILPLVETFVPSNSFYLPWRKSI